MTYEIATVLCGGPGPVLPGNPRVNIIDNQDNRRTPCQAYQQALDMTNTDVSVLIYVHDDVTVHDPDWMDRIIGAFKRQDAMMAGASDIVAVGLGGATALGNRDLYRTPYRIENMARRGYASDQSDAEVHGERFTGVRRVAVLDAFCMAVRTDWLRTRRTWGEPGRGTAFQFGWPTSRLTHHCLDLWLACEAARDHKEIWLVGASCTHHGGGSSTKEVYAQAPWLLGGSVQTDHTEPHLWLYNEYRDVLPVEVPA